MKGREIGNWYWCPSIERDPYESRRYFGFRLFAFGASIFIGKTEFTIRIVVPR